MKPIYLTGHGLACSLGLSIPDSLVVLRAGGRQAVRRSLPGRMTGDYPFHAIPCYLPDWNERAQTIVQRVAAEAGAERMRDGVLLIATSSFDIGAIEQGAAQMDHDYLAFSTKVANWLAWTGPVHIISTACTSGLNALLVACALLRNKVARDVLVLGIELDNQLTLGGFAALQLLSRTGCKPFGAERDGLVLGEAVAALALSSQTTGNWCLLGGANVVDGELPTGSSTRALGKMYERALMDSGLNAEDIDLIKVQAAGSPTNDAVEAKSLCQNFAVLPPLVSLKPMIGHTMGASGAAEIALLIACLESGIWPTQERAIDATLGIALADRMPTQIRYLMATILGFGGGHASVILEHV